ncbi:peptidase M24, structural domain-containing protein [Exophiala viscosa]|uniref:peptidase M24, structural domain-containing protein n=1 Tax=Exophiala viscosa TaxID=2486360 RepID=UPI002191AEB7|nr:peptidase M24, structural domain-containing protein [Exophiala viscosa]
MGDPSQSLPNCAAAAIRRSETEFEEVEVQDEPPAGLVKAQRLAIQVAEQIAKETVPGQTEKEVVVRIDNLIKTLGGVGVWTPTVVGFGIGTLSCFPTDVPSDRPLWNIDLGHLDVHPVTDDGWLGDCTRMIQAGDNRPQATAHATIRSIHAHVLESAYSGMRACDLFSIFAEALADTKYLLLDRLQNIGHSLAQNSSYDAGYIDAYNETIMEGAWAVEPFIGNHLYGVKLEDVLWFGKTKVTIIR